MALEQPTTYNQGEYSKVRLFGKKSTPEEVRKYLVNEVIQGAKITVLARSQNTTTKTIYEYLKWAQDLGEISKDGNTWKRNEAAKQQQEWQRFTENHKIVDDPYVKDWVEDLMTRGYGGGKISKAPDHIRHLEYFCNYLEINPVQLVFAKDRNVVAKYLTNFSTILYAGKTHHVPKKMELDKKTPKWAGIMKGYKDAIRSFVQFHGIAIPNRIKGILANPVIGHGQYADVKLTDEELHAADLWLTEKYGVHHPFYRLFWVGVESCSRQAALFSMALDWRETKTRHGKVLYEMTAFESKTKHLNGGKWTKYIMREKTREALSWAKKYEDSGLLYPGAPNKTYDDFKDALVELYRHLGKTPEANPYFFEHQVHTLRHVGAHYWLRKTKYNYGVVAKIGGWHKIQELKDSYGEMPSEVLFDVMEENASGLNAL